MTPEEKLLEREVHLLTLQLSKKQEALEKALLEVGRAHLFIRRFSRWVETPQKPDLFFGKLNLLYLGAAPFDDDRTPTPPAEED